MVLSISIHLCNTSGFVTSGSKTNSHFRKLNLQKGLNLPQILLEVHETLQAFSACPNKQKSQRWPTSIFCSFQDNNHWRLRNVTFTKNTNMNGNLFFILYSFFKHYIQIVFKISASYLHYSFFNEFLKIYIETMSSGRI